MVEIKSQHIHWEEFTNKRKFSHPVVAFFGIQRFQYISKFIQMNEIKNALDVASGLGWSSAHIPKHIPTTVTDFSLNQIKHNPKKDKVICISTQLPFNDRSFSLVYGWEFLHHVSDPYKTVKEMSRIAKNYLVLIEPNRNNVGHFFYGIVRKHERGTLRYHKDMMYKLVRNINFEIVTCKTVGWTFAGSTPQFLLPLIKKLPYELPLVGTSNIMICKRRD